MPKRNQQEKQTGASSGSWQKVAIVISVLTTLATVLNELTQMIEALAKVFGAK